MRRLERRGELPTIIDRSRDLFFRFLLGRPDRMELLLNLLNAIFYVLGYSPVVRVGLRETELPPDAAGLKHSRLDILAVDEWGRSLSIELQRKIHAWLVERCLLYLDKIFPRGAKEGKDYDELNPTVMIMLLTFDYFKEETQALWNFLWMDSRAQKVLTHAQQLIFVEMNKIRKGIDELVTKLRHDSEHVMTQEERLAIWCSYLCNDERSVELVQTVLTKDPVFRRVNELEQEYWNSPEYRYLQLREQMAEMDDRAVAKTNLMAATAAAREEGWTEGIVLGRKEGREEGRTEGREEALLATALRMRAGGLSDAQIAEFTGLSVSELKDIWTTAPSRRASPWSPRSRASRT